MFFLHLKIDPESSSYVFSSDEEKNRETLQCTASYQYGSDTFETEEEEEISSIVVMFALLDAPGEVGIIRGYSLDARDSHIVLEIALPSSAFDRLREVLIKNITVKASLGDVFDPPDIGPTKVPLRRKSKGSSNVVWDTSRAFALKLADFSIGIPLRPPEEKTSSTSESAPAQAPSLQPQPTRLDAIKSRLTAVIILLAAILFYVAR